MAGPYRDAPASSVHVPHMKWWGWGLEEIRFDPSGKPGFLPFVRAKVGIDLTARADREPPAFDALDVPGSRASTDLAVSLGEITGPENVSTAPRERVIHAYGKGFRDLMRVRDGRFGRPPDIVVYPGSETEVAAVLDLAARQDLVVVPFGGGSNIVGSLEAAPDEQRIVVSVDMGRMNRVLHIDAVSGLARVEAGTRGPDLERQLGEAGWTVGHFPDSFTHSTVGGWVATRSSGMQSDKYGDIADITKGLRLARPDGILTVPAMPSTSTGPSLRELILGSEGRLGVITEVTVQVHPIPEHREVRAYLFASWEDGLSAMRAIAHSDLRPTLTRLSDANETAFSLAAGSQRSAMLGRLLKLRGWNEDEVCLSFVGFEGSRGHVATQRRAVARIVRANRGFGLGTKPGELYDRKKFDTPYLRDFFLDHNGIADVSETAAPWSILPGLYRGTYEAAEAAFIELGVHGWIMAHLSHSYRSGACLYFTFAFESPGRPLEAYEVVKRAVQQAFIDGGGTVSHHHGVGVEHAPWLRDHLSRSGHDLLAAIFAEADPGRRLNPGAIIV